MEVASECASTASRACVVGCIDWPLAGCTILVQPGSWRLGKNGSTQAGGTLEITDYDFHHMEPISDAAAAHRAQVAGELKRYPHAKSCNETVASPWQHYGSAVDGATAASSPARRDLNKILDPVLAVRAVRHDGRLLLRTVRLGWRLRLRQISFHALHVTFWLQFKPL